MKSTQLALISVLAITYGSAAGAQSSEPTDLGTLGGSESVATSITHDGKLVGGYSTIVDDSATHGTLWLGRTIVDLGVFSGGTNSSVAGVAIGGRAAGTSDFDDPVYGVVPHAFLYADGALRNLGTLGGSQSQATSIDVFNAVAGYSFTADDAATHAFVSNPFKSNKLADLGTLGGVNSQAFTINDLGLVGGTSNTTELDQYGNQISDAVVWNTLTGKAYDLGNLGGETAQITALNNLGMAAGEGSISTDPASPIHLFVTYLGAKGLKDIGTLGGSYAQANGINAEGVVVGFSNTGDDRSVDAFAWTAKGGLVDLNSLLPAGSPWTLVQASAIADNGTIVGYGYINGEAHAFSWTLPNSH